MKRIICIGLLLLFSQYLNATQVKLITTGPGDAFWSAFGHTAIVIDDVVYGFGYFSFDDELFFSFINNDMQYDIGVTDLNREYYLAQQQNRDLTMVELNVTPAQSAQLQAHLQWHLQPENQSYSYDYFLNNCSTKIRDLLRMAWGPEFEQRAKSMAVKVPENSYMAQTFPAKHQGLMNFGLALGYGWAAYTERNVWELMAFPVFLEQSLLNHYDTQISAQQVLFEAAASDAFISLFLTHWMLFVYVLLWLLVLHVRRLKNWFAKAWFVWHGLVGCTLLALWLLTPHTVADWNFNILLMMPLGVLLPKYKQLLPLMPICWMVWLGVAIYLQAWYLMPLLIPAIFAWKVIANNTQPLLNRT